MVQSGNDSNLPLPDRESAPTRKSGRRHTGAWIGLGLALGVLCGLLFGEYCKPLQIVGNGYVGLLQMTVLPYLVLTLIAKVGRLDGQQARKMGITALLVLVVFWTVGITLIVGVSEVLPPVQAATFFSPAESTSESPQVDLLTRFIPANVFQSLASEYVPAVVLFCLFFGLALMAVPGKERVLDLLDLCSVAISRINIFLIRLAPLGLFMLSAAAAGSLRFDELARLQAYLIAFALACVVASLIVLPFLVSSLTDIDYRSVLRAAQEPVLTAFATGKLFIVLPQIVENCDDLIATRDGASAPGKSTPSIVTPLAYSFPHVGKILTFLFISFAAWYVGKRLSLEQTLVMASEGTVSSFASPLVTIPALLDQYQLPQDLMALFILPGFITTRIADMVGVVHLMSLTLIVTCVMEGRLQIRWQPLMSLCAVAMICLGVLGGATRWYLSTVALDYDLDERLLSLSIHSPNDNVVVYKTGETLPSRPAQDGLTLDRIRADKVFRVGYHPDHLPYSFFNQAQELVGLDVELMHRLATRLQTRLEFVPYEYDSVVTQLKSGEIDVAIGGLILKPERLLSVGFTQPYQTATLAVVARDDRRNEFRTLEELRTRSNLRLAVVQQDLANAARRHFPNIDVVVIDSYHSFFDGTTSGVDGLIMPAEEGAAWNVLYPEYAVIVPKPAIRRPVAMAVRSEELEWRGLLDGWLEFERLDGSLDDLRAYWVEGGGTKERPPRWCVMRDVLHWLP